MAPQVDYTVSLHSEEMAGSTNFAVMAEKEGDRQKKELAKLGSALMMLEHEVAGAKSGVEEGSKETFDESMAKMMLMLQLLQVKVAKFNDDKSKMDGSISESQIQLAIQNLKNVEKQVQKIEREERKARKWGIFGKIFSIVVTVVTTIVAAVTLNPALVVMAVISATMMTLALTGGMKKLTDLCTDLFLDMGMSKKAAEVLGSVLVVLAVVVATAAVYPESAFEAAPEAAAADVAEDAADVEASATKRFLSLVKSFGSKLADANPFGKLSAKANLSILTGVQAAEESGLPASLARAMSNSESFLEGIEIAFGIIGGLTSVGAGAALFSGAGSDVEALGEEAETKFQAAIRKLKAWMGDFTSDRLVKGLLTTQTGSQVIEGVSRLELGLLQVIQGRAEIALGALQGDQVELDAAEKMSEGELKSDQREQALFQQSQKTGERASRNIMAGEAGFASLFTNYSPV